MTRPNYSKAKPNNRQAGKEGEERALMYLSSQGFIPVATNYMPSSSCEADIIAYDRGTLVGVEVKSLQRLSWDEEDIAKRVNLRKRNKVKRASYSFATKSLVPFTSLRLDVVSLTKGKIVHYKGVES